MELDSSRRVDTAYVLIALRVAISPQLRRIRPIRESQLRGRGPKVSQARESASLPLTPVGRADLAVAARLTLTTSDTHDPAITPLAPKSLDPSTLAHPTKSTFGTGMRAYAASRLCNLLTARSLANSPELRQRFVTVIAYNPGRGTNLGSPSAGAERFMTMAVFPVFRIIGRFKPAYAMGRPERAGQVLAQLATGAVTPPTGRVYVSWSRARSPTRTPRSWPGTTGSATISGTRAPTWSALYQDQGLEQRDRYVANSHQEEGK
jgi:NAD(P)-dependent dehydrogenase (short-subunit alcohol dehydrogenase family)